MLYFVLHCYHSDTVNSEKEPLKKGPDDDGEEDDTTEENGDLVSNEVTLRYRTALIFNQETYLHVYVNTSLDCTCTCTCSFNDLHYNGYNRRMLEWSI